MKALLVVAGIALCLAPVASARLPNPCGLLTNAEVTRALGSKVETRQMTGGGRYRVCTWKSAPLGTFTSARAQLIVQVIAESQKDFIRSANANSGAVRVRGIGTSAFSMSGPGAFLNVWQGGYALQFAVSGAPDTSTAKTIARIAVKRL